MPNYVVDWKTITDFVVDAFVGVGVPREDAEICADVLLESDKRGIESHGVNRFKPIYIDRINIGIQNPVTNFEILRETPTTAVVDGHDGMGQVIGYKAMKMAIEKAKKYGMGMVAVRNSCHYGIAGYYASMAIKEGMIGITGTNARPSIAPTFGVENMLGTNPLTIGFPTDEEFPFILDCATSITQRGKIEYYARIGKPTPAGMVIGRDGSAMTDSEQILIDLTKEKAALAPLGGIGEELGGYKGYGYATVVEVLSAALQQGSYLKMLTGVQDGKKVPYHLGHFFIAIDTEAFMGLEAFKKTAGDIMRELRNSEKAPGCERIYTAGEKEWEVWLQRKDSGVPINEAVQKELIEIRNKLGLTKYVFPWEK
ncbi:MAG TPA: Ldh family oxidoreductase [Clostridia bacterium]|jgi:L-2-hydroxycarboxylate dehydrogenase (NAD+)|nr:Ldh family oxidoreductase [Clostridia bacterium]HOL60539.1 Ldh family oxidoreductase [Clostridia bacterium]HPO52946.1 Ldh family oxidoreductase [Clostridia bacterium]